MLTDTTSVVSWLHKNLGLQQDEKVQSEEILYLFNEQSAVNGGPTLKSIRQLHEITKAIFPEVEVVRLGSLDKRYMKNLALQECPLEVELPFTLASLVSLVPGKYAVRQPSNDVLEIHVPANFKQDKRFPLKKIILRNNGTWNLQIDESDVDVCAIEISPTYRFTAQDITSILALVAKVKLCKGKTYEGNPSTRSCSTHSIEDSSGTIKVIRSQHCCQILPFRGNKFQCEPCRKVNICHLKARQQSPRQSPQYEMTEEKLREILHLWIPNLKPTALELVISQFSNCRGRQNRWTDYQTTLQTCLRLWIRSKEAYRQFRAGSGLDLPSESCLRRHKNAVPQVTGIDQVQMQWMLREAEKLNLGEFGMTGGILIDEMAIQPGLELIRKGEYLEFVGFSDLGLANSMEYVRNGNTKKSIADHVLQITFQGLTSFTFPIAHYPTTQTSAQQLHLIFWQVVKMLRTYGFKVAYCSIDGAQSNRTFLNKCVRFGDPEKMIGKSRGCDPVIFIMDVSHVIKKIRNSLLKSKPNGIRLVTLTSGKHVMWQHFIDAYSWDLKNPIAIHKNLTNEHILDVMSNDNLKMRNYLAEDVLNNEMLHLMKCYAAFLGNEASHLDGTIAFLEITSVICRIFRDSFAMYNMDDVRANELKKVLKWFGEWQAWAMNREDLKLKDRRALLLTSQTMDDIKSCLAGFLQLLNYVAEHHQGSSLIPSNINSDAIENGFCQQRSLYNGANSNPTYATYMKNQNSAILLQPVVSRKGNASASHHPATPFTLTQQYMEKAGKSSRKLFSE